MPKPDEDHFARVEVHPLELRRQADLYRDLGSELEELGWTTSVVPRKGVRPYIEQRGGGRDSLVQTIDDVARIRLVLEVALYVGRGEFLEHARRAADAARGILTRARRLPVARTIEVVDQHGEVILTVRVPAD